MLADGTRLATRRTVRYVPGPEGDEAKALRLRLEERRRELGAHAAPPR